MVNGYFQIPLHTSSQHLTIFMTPWGRYKFLRASMGLCSSSEEYNWRADLAFQGAHNTVRVVDDLLRFDSLFSEYEAGVCAVLSAARSVGMTLSMKKFHFTRPQVQGVRIRVVSRQIQTSFGLFRIFQVQPISRSCAPLWGWSNISPDSPQPSWRQRLLIGPY